MTKNFEYRILPVTQRFELSKKTVQILKSLKPNFGYNGLGEFVFRRTYSRDNEDWADVVIRVIQGVFSIRKEHYYRNVLEWDDVKYQQYAHDMALSMFNMHWLPAGRGLWMCGTDFVYQRGSFALFNCGAFDTEKDLVHALEWSMDALMNGTGIGFSTYWRGTATVPDKTDTELFVIPDSREGWIESVIRLTSSYIDSPRYGKSKFPVFDYSLIRQSGLPIHGFGGISSGPEPLIKLHSRIETYLDNFCQGYIEVNGVQKPYNHTRLVADLFNAVGCCVVAGNVRRCLPGNAMVHTINGLVPIKDVEIGDLVLTSRKEYRKVSNKFEQGVQKLVKIITASGEFRCTSNHKMAVYDEIENIYKWTPTSDIRREDLLLTNKDLSPSCWFKPDEVLDIVEDKEEETWDIEVEEKHEFFCNGYLTHNSAEISIGKPDDQTFMDLKNYDKHPERAEIGWSSNNSIALSAEKDFADFFCIPDIAERISKNGEPGCLNMYNIQKYGRYGKESHDPATLVNPCAEICLESGELCNLAEVFPPRCNDPQEFYKGLEYATFYTTTVSLLPTHRPETNSVIARNRRIGVSISGFAQLLDGAVPKGWGENITNTDVINFLRKGYKIVSKINEELSAGAGVPKAIRLTTVKPSGSISLLTGCAPGAHFPVSRYSIRRVRVAMNSPLVDPLIKADVPHEKDIYSDNTWVFSFPIDHGPVRSAEEVTPFEQFNNVAMLQKHYSDNSVSVTIYFNKEKDDAKQIEKLLSYYLPVLKTVSMLPHSGHSYAQAPYEPIDKETYEKLLSNHHMPDFSKVTANEPVGEKYCDGDKCEVRPK